MGKHPLQTKNPDKDVRGTPPRVFRELDYVYHFTLDVAASDDNALCPKYFTKEQDGLAQSWQGETVWCNPPYSNIRPWVEKAWVEGQGDCRVVMLLPALTDVRWFHDVVLPHAKIQFLRGRLSFGMSSGQPAPFGSMLAFFPKDRF